MNSGHGQLCRKIALPHLFIRLYANIIRLYANAASLLSVVEIISGVKDSLSYAYARLVGAVSAEKGGGGVCGVMAVAQVPLVFPLISPIIYCQLCRATSVIPQQRFGGARV